MTAASVDAVNAADESLWPVRDDVAPLPRAPRLASPPATAEVFKQSPDYWPRVVAVFAPTGPRLHPLTELEVREAVSELHDASRRWRKVADAAIARGDDDAAERAAGTARALRMVAMFFAGTPDVRDPKPARAEWREAEAAALLDRLRGED